MNIVNSVGVFSKIPNLLTQLRLKLPHITFLECATAQDVDRHKSTAIVADFDLLGPILYTLPSVNFVQGTWAGIDALVPYVENPPAFPIARFSGKHFGRIISEYILTCIVNHERDLLHVYENQQSKIWSQQSKISNYRIISDLNVGIMGIGNIGSHLGTYLNAFGAQIVAYGKRTSIDKVQFPYIHEYCNELQVFLQNCDYIINTMPNTAQTKGLLNGNVLESCKDKGTVFINVGRGSIIDDQDLLAALNNGWISAAYLDVFNTEPLPVDNALWNLRQVKITPHVAAMSRAKDIAEQFADNLHLFTTNQQIPTIVDFSRGY